MKGNAGIAALNVIIHDKIDFYIIKPYAEGLY